MKTKRAPEAAPARPKAAPARPVDDAEDDDDRKAAPVETKQVALDTRDATGDILDDQDEASDVARLVKPARPPANRGWQVAIGPYLWASSVEANVSLGPVSTGLDIGFIPIARHARYGAELLAEVRYGRFAVYGDLMYGAASVTSSTTIASLMVMLTGNASSLLVDGAAGYRLIGDDNSVVSLEARAGIRYQRTEIDGEISVTGGTVKLPGSADAGSDAVVGARGVVQPASWLFLSGVVDYGVVGVSDRTWSASADASLRVFSHVLVSAGWRTLVMERALVSLTMQGPRVAVQLVF